MVAKKSLTSSKKPVLNKKNVKKQDQKDQEPVKKELSKSKLKKQEFQRKKYNKDKKKKKNNTEEDDDSDFEIVPTTTSKSIMDSDESNSDDDSDLEQDMFGKFKAKKPVAVPVAASTASVKQQKPITMNDSEDEDQEEKFIASETLAANRKNKKSGGFQSMGLSNPVFKAIIHKGFKVPTPVQRKCIPLILQGDDVVGMARTGSGKTAAFLIPMLERLKTHSAKTGARGLVLSPSRELALQTQKVCKELMKYTDLRSGCIVGGDSLDEQFEMIASNPDILIATPGRLLHLAVEMNLDMRTIEYVVFDEADRLFEMGFAVQLHEILSRLPPTRQTLLFSATLPKMLVDFAKAGLQEPTLVRLDVDTKISRDLEMAFFSVKDNEKEGALLYLLKNVIKLPKKTQNEDQSDIKRYKKKNKEKSGTEADHQTILFAATKHHVEYLANVLQIAGYQVSYVYGSLDQTARNIQINRFRNGVTNILVVTDVAARGIDIPILENVINYDFCGSSKVFVHRVGRAARAGRRGWAYSLVTSEELPYVVDLHLFLTRPLVLGGEKDEYDYTSELVLGAMPKDALIDDKAWVDDKVSKDAALEGTYRTAMNAYKLYNRTKPRASPESYGRAKEFLKKTAYNNLHPLLVNEENSNAAELERVNMLNAISGFRPAETIFEFGVRGTRKLTPATSMMRERRQHVDKIISAHKSKVQAESAVINKPVEIRDEDKIVQELGGDVEEEELAETFNIPESKEDKKTKNFRDEEYYMSYTQKDANTERGYSMNNEGSFMEQASKAQLDLTGDDNEGILKNKNMMRWDSKKHKFVKGSGIGADNKKMIRTESGALISASFKSGRFDEWAKKKRITLPRAGERELAGAGNMSKKRFRHNKSEDAKPLDPLSYDYDKKLKKRKMNESEGPSVDKSGLGKKRVGNANAKSELKNASQIRKDRIAYEKRKAKSTRPGRKSSRGKGRK
ncbi:P-loop containing nucleoside triphosphate hydrolase protein [Gilbertella persicaria]|uniref:RNA helicase n=1 Tax=Rhizopus stolonifer TaxID=4846 RepID=A0A367K1Q0_RHIST|nr:P-loop containing nucleoside triphosphate hydrolase protein [Gilbertella persicaria]KAI8059942.1 P-loop containing nucleoside triphosphate hydrolase protein [Gilbertella persicaria]RCH95821.1 ATP-dependent RNA helicase dbp10 [Rhizopus stolonifer]